VNIRSYCITRCSPLNVSTVVFRRSFGSLPDHDVITMPKLSPTMESGTIGAWLKKVGDAIEPGDLIADIETDKATVSFEAQDSFVLAKILKDEGSADIPVGDPIAISVSEQSDVAAFENYTGPSSSPEKEKEQPPTPPKTEQSPAESVSMPSPTPSAPPPKAQPSSSALSEVIEGNPFEDIIATKFQKVSAVRLLEAKQQIPHFYVSGECSIDAMLQLRKEHNAALSPGQVKLSVNDFVVKAAAQALKDVPSVNSQWLGDRIREYRKVDISIAVMTPVGLITPIVFDAQSKKISQISAEVKALAALAKENKLKPEQFIGGTFTISNLGMYGVRNFSAVINPPQSAILAVGGSEKVITGLTEDGKNAKVSEMLRFRLSADHRVIDGTVAAEWLNAFKHYLSNPINLIL